MTPAEATDIRERIRRMEDRLTKVEIRIWILAFAGSIAGSAIGSGGMAMASTLLGG